MRHFEWISREDPAAVVWWVPALVPFGCHFVLDYEGEERTYPSLNAALMHVLQGALRFP